MGAFRAGFRGPDRPARPAPGPPAPVGPVAGTPRIVRFPAAAALVGQGDRGTDVCLVLDGVIRVERDGERLAEYGPGALLGERAHLEGGLRTSSLVAVTPCRVAAVDASQLDRS